ncbi:MAG TPA: IS3 family transposase [Anaerolineales bacterium]|nr:IS3 family transposase [Anaerolineales bacterium]
MAIKRRTDELYTAHPYYGSRKLAVLLQPEYGVSRPTVQAYMSEMGISAVVPGPNTSQSAPEHQIYPYLLRNVSAQHPNHIWGIDITYVRLKHGSVYLAVLMDVCTRAIRGWHLGRTLEQALTLEALLKAFATQHCPQIHHSDQGVQYAATEYTELLQAQGVRISMAEVGEPTQNGYAERLMRTIKQEEVDLSDYEDYHQAYQQIGRFLEEVYMRKRVHSALSYLTPAEFEAQWH